MNRSGLKYGLCVVVMLCMGCMGWAIVIPSTGTATYTMTDGETLTVTTPMGYYGDEYPNSCDGALVVNAIPGALITVTGSGELEYAYDYVDIYDGTNSSGTFLGRATGLVTSISLACVSGSVYFYFHSDYSYAFSGLSMTLSCCYPNENITNLRDSAVSGSEAWVLWDDASDATQWEVYYGDASEGLSQMATVNEPRIHLQSLTEGKSYMVKVFDATEVSDCGSVVYLFTVPCENGNLCVDFTDLTSCIVNGTYGFFTNPNAVSGIVDYGSSSSMSRHTVHRDVTEYDPRTNNMLKTVPVGELASVRLGNWKVGAEAESITYLYTVDTSVYDLLVMRYAAVLENPEHTAAEQPRFKFKILNENYEEINPNCYSADYISSEALGWNVVNTDDYWGSTVLWKDWTTVGVDLDQLHGQTIYIQLTTYDCEQSGHYGYAYFTLRCSNKVIRSSSCGNSVANTFTAPAGFTYQWYKEDAPAVVLGTNQSLSVTEAGTYKCKMSMVGATSDECGLTMSAVAGYRYPYARFDANVSGDTCDFMIQFRERSVVTGDMEHTILTDESCEAVEWFFGDGESSTERNPVHQYAEAGEYVVRMVASLSNGACTDTIVDTIGVGMNCPRTVEMVDEVCSGGSYQFFDTVLTMAGVYSHVEGVLTTILTLTVADPLVERDMDTIVENSLPWHYGGYVFEDAVMNDTLEFSTAAGCDSLVIYNLLVHRNVYSDVDSVICENALPLMWNGVRFAEAGRDTVVMAGAAMHGVDSTVRMELMVLQNSVAERWDTVVERNLPYSYLNVSFDTVVEDSTLVIENDVGCDSVIHFNLHVWWNSRSDVDSAVCEGALPLVWNGVTFADAGVDTAVLIGAAIHGEDSIVRMNVSILGDSEVDWFDTVVENDLPYRYLDFEFNTDVDTTLVIENNLGCDSIIHYHLFVHRNVDTSLYEEICADALPYTWEGVVFDVAGMQEKVLQNRFGADSTLRLNLVVHEVYDVSIQDSMCLDGSYQFGTQTCTQSGTYVETFATVHGCDSVVTLDLTLKKNKYSIEKLILCRGTTLTWQDGVTYDSPTNTPHVVLAAANGCDSVVTLNLDTNTHLKARIWASPTWVPWDHTEVNLIDKSEGHNSRLWLLPDMISEERYFTYQYTSEEDSIEVMLVAGDKYGCEDTAHTWIRREKGQIWTPNVFTPCEPENNIFKVGIEDVIDIEVIIYDRRGGFIYRYNTLDGGWDGTKDGTMCPQASYVYHVRYRTKAYPDRYQEKVGTVTLLR